MDTATAIPGKLTIGSDGKLRGPARIEYNTPFPCPNGTPGAGAATMLGLVEHTMVGNLPGTIAVFNNPAYQASADIGIDQTGLIHQFGPLGLDWEAWAQVYGNPDWYDAEFADDGNPDNPLTQPQIVAGAQFLECVSAFAGFPLEITNSVGVKGFGIHSMGGQNWGGHTCPDLPPRHVRSQQRPAIITLAKLIRAGESGWSDFTTTGGVSLLALAGTDGTLASTILRKTIEAHGSFSNGLTAYINHGDLTAPMPAGLVVRVPASPAG